MNFIWNIHVNSFPASTEASFSLYAAGKEALLTDKCLVYFTVSKFATCMHMSHNTTLFAPQKFA